jgi:chorismate synthase
MQKYSFDEARPVLERASARETATRVALGRVAQNFLRDLGIELVTHTVAIGTAISDSVELPRPKDVASLDEDPVRAFDKSASAAMVAEIDECHS